MNRLHTMRSFLKTFLFCSRTKNNTLIANCNCVQRVKIENLSYNILNIYFNYYLKTVNIQRRCSSTFYNEKDDELISDKLYIEKEDESVNDDIYKEEEKTIVHRDIFKKQENELICDDISNKNTTELVCDVVYRESECLPIIVNLIRQKDNFDEIRKHLALQECVKEIPYFTNNNLLTLIINLVFLEEKFGQKTRYCHVLKNLIRKIDEECEKRAGSWNMDTFLYFLQKFVSLRTIRSNEHKQFLIYALRSRYPKVFKSPLPSILKYIRTMNKTIFWKKYHVNTYEIVHVLKQNFSNLTISEMASLLQALTYLGVKIYDEELQKSILDNLVNQFDSATSDILFTFLKFLALQLNVLNPAFLTSSYVSLLKHLNREFDKIDFKSISYASLICAEMIIYDSEFLNNVALRLSKLPPPQKIHELIFYRNALHSLTFFNFHSDSFSLYHQLLNNMKNEKFYRTLFHYPKVLVTIISTMSSISGYPFNLISKLLSDQFLEKTYYKNQQNHDEFCIPVSIFRIAYGVKLEHPKYNGNMLRSDLLKKLTEKICYRLPKCFNLAGNDFDTYLEKYNLRSTFFLKPYNKTIYDAYCTLNTMFEDSCCAHICYLLPQYPNVNILFCLDDNNIPQKLPEFIKNTVLVDNCLLDKKLHWIVLSVLVRNSVFKCDNPLFGHEVPKVRQLNLLGYKVINLIADEWLEFSPEEKVQYLERNISKFSLSLQFE